MPILQTPLCNLLNIELPIIQAPIGGAAGPALAAAVSNAGGLGVITQAHLLDIDAVRRWTREVRGLTDRPFAVNLLLIPRDDRQRVLLGGCPDASGCERFWCARPWITI